MKKGLFLLLLVGGLQSAQAKKGHDHHEHRQGSKHVHGSGALEITNRLEVLTLTLKVPGMDLFGFEHEPKTKREKSIRKKALSSLQTKEWFQFGGTNCTQSKIETNTKHQAHSEKKHGHGHGHKEHKETHSDVQIDFEYSCSEIAKLKTIRVGLFDGFKGMKELHTEWAVGDAVGKTDLNKKKPLITVKQK